jgi:tRNA-modifying protein YgfZ
MNQAFRIEQVLQGVAPLPHWGVIQVVGEDAAKFLHGQLTQDFSLLGASQARLAALCSAKGRMLASFIGFKRSETEILLLVSRDILAPTLKRLSMYVLRAKAKLVDASDQFILAGLAGDAVAAAVTGGGLATWARQESGAASLVGLPPVHGVARALWVAPAGTPSPQGLSLAAELWQWSEVESGIAAITAPIVEAFVPQMLNYESVGGVNFKKGCYPGQEVVARSQFRGTLKRRAFLVHADAPLAAGQEVFHQGDFEQPCGTVAQVAPAPSGGYDAIVSMQLSAAGGDALPVGTADGPALTLRPLPYPLLDDI